MLLNQAYRYLVIIAAAAVCARADVRPASIFADHMILQRNARLPIWGWAGPGESVSVSFAGQTSKTAADANGNWQVILDPVNSERPQKMTVIGTNTVEINDILMGEVWVCSGQSNMGVPISESYDAAREIAAADYPQIRVYEVEHHICPDPDRKLGGSWVICSPKTAPQLTAVGYFFAREVYQQIHVPIGLVHTSWGGTPAEAWTQWEALKSNPKLSGLVTRFEDYCREYPRNKIAYDAAMKDWERKVSLAHENGLQEPAQPFMPMGPMHFQRPSGLYNGMVISIVPYAMRGVIWYQGECNAGRGIEYADVLPTMIKSWRNAWGKGDFPFYIVQISAWSHLQETPNEISGWPRVRDAQAKTAEELPNCHIVVTIDIGDAETNHPKNKQDVGKRLAIAALAAEYGKTDFLYKSPTYKNISAENGRIRLNFDNTGGQLQSKLSGFVIAGEDLNYEWADARVEGQSVIVSSPKVPNPVAVRYAWANNPACSLYNKAGLPAVPFQAQLPNIHVLAASQDTYIDESKPDKNFGTSKYLRIQNEGTPGTECWALIRWDLANANLKNVDNVTFRGIQIDGPVGDGFDIYVITSGDWNENEVTWNKWNDMKTKIAFIGSMRSVSYPDGISTFSSPSLTDVVRRWLADIRQNHGLLLKYHYGTVYTGDSLFAAGYPEEFYDPPQLIIDSSGKNGSDLHERE